MKTLFVCVFSMILFLPNISSAQWIYLIQKAAEFVAGDTNMAVTIHTGQSEATAWLDITVANKEEKRIMRYVKLKIDRSLLEGYQVKGYDPPPEKEVDWGPLHFTIKYEKSVQLTPGESSTLRIYLQPKKKGVFKGEVEVHALKGYYVRFRPVIYAVTLQNK